MGSDNSAPISALEQEMAMLGNPRLPGTMVERPAPPEEMQPAFLRPLPPDHSPMLLNTSSPEASPSGFTMSQAQSSAFINRDTSSSSSHRQAIEADDEPRCTPEFGGEPKIEPDTDSGMWLDVDVDISRTEHVSRPSWEELPRPPSGEPVHMRLPRPPSCEPDFLRPASPSNDIAVDMTALYQRDDFAFQASDWQDVEFLV